jgi:hypothetical protein
MLYEGGAAAPRTLHEGGNRGELLHPNAARGGHCRTPSGRSGVPEVQWMPMSRRAGWHQCLLACTALIAGLLVACYGRRASAEPSAAGQDADAVRKPPIPVSFLVHNAGWIELLYPPSARDRVGALLAHAEDARAELAELLGQPPVQAIEVRLARSTEEMAALAPIELPPSGEAVGIAYPNIRLLLLSLAGPDGSGNPDLVTVFRRELARYALQEATAPKRPPEWFQNGFADRFSGRLGWRQDGTLLWSAVRHKLVPLLADTGQASAAGQPRAAIDERPNELIVAESADFLDFLLAAPRHTRFPTCVDALHRGQSLPGALQEAYSSDAFVLELSWRRQIARRATLTLSALATGVPVLGAVVVIAIRSLRRRKNRPLEAMTGPRQQRLPKASSERRRVHIVLSRRGEAPDLASIVQSDIPKIEHDGEWHTLH